MQAARSLPPADWASAAPTQAVFDAIERAGGEARFVGGCVRNALLGEPVADVDLATTLTPDAATAALEAAGLSAIPTGLAHGTITARTGGRAFEITTLRRDVSTDGRRATVAFTTDWAEDAARRDFTMNALYARRDGTVDDPVGGLPDLDARRVRFIGDAATRIAEDHLRILRFFRFHAWYGRGELDLEGLSACSTARGSISALSGERLHDELLKLLAAPDPAPTLRQMAATGVLAEVLPGPLDFDRFGRLVEIERDQLFREDAQLRLGALLAGDEAQRIGVANRLRCSNDEKARLAALQRTDVKIVSYLSIREVRRALYRLGVRAFKDIASLRWASDRKLSNAPQWRALLALADSWVRPELPLDGHDVQAAGVPAGPEVGRVMAEVEDWWIDADFTDDKFSAIERLKAVVQATVY